MPKVDFFPGKLYTYGPSLAAALAVILADQVTKLLVRNSLSLNESFPSDGVLRFTFVGNEGIVFGISAPAYVALLLPLVMIAVVVYLYRRFGLVQSPIVKAAVALFIGGSVGNFIDRVWLGYVTDFIDIRLWGGYHWPAFNIADIALVAAVILAIIYFWRYHPEAESS